MATYTIEFRVPQDFPTGSVRQRLEQAGKIRKFGGPDSEGFYRATINTPYQTFSDLETQVRYYVAGPLSLVRQVEGVGVSGETVVTGVVAVLVGAFLWTAFRYKEPFLRDQS